MLSEANSSSCFPNVSQGLKMHPAVTESFASSSVGVGGGRETRSDYLLYSISLMKEKVHQVQGLVGVLISPDRNQQQPESTSIAMANMGSLVQEIISTASTILFTCQQMTHVHGAIDGGNFYSGDETFENWYGENYYNCNPGDDHNRASMITTMNASSGIRVLETNQGSSEVANSSQNCDIIEVDAANLLAKYTHYCQVCGKGFKRDANLRMHMRAHGDEYKTSAALTNPLKNINGNAAAAAAVKSPGWKYSCPQEGCRWNQKHAKFQPLKSMICVKNHYRRSHCPKMYVCKRCNRKQFSVPSDLRTHEKHCGQLKWQCSCGTTFSRKDKLMGHVALFVGHTPRLVGISTTTTASTKPNN